MFLLNQKATKTLSFAAKFTIQNVPIKLKNNYLPFEEIEVFTIQNVPIKYIHLLLYLVVYLYLQYKMFLLNVVEVKEISIDKEYLQYKMFLLNLIFLKLPI